MLAKIKCFFGQHERYYIKNIGIISYQVGCKNCPKFWWVKMGLNVYLPWNTDIEKKAEEWGKFLSLKDRKEPQA